MKASVAHQVTFLGAVCLLNVIRRVELVHTTAEGLGRSNHYITSDVQVKCMTIWWVWLCKEVGVVTSGLRSRWVCILSSL